MRFLTVRLQVSLISLEIVFASIYFQVRYVLNSGARFFDSESYSATFREATVSRLDAVLKVLASCSGTGFRKRKNREAKRLITVIKV